MKLRLTNLTGHTVAIIDGNETLAQWPPSGQMARLAEVVSEPAALHTDQGEIPLVSVSHADAVSGLPEPEEGRAFIVSRILAAAVGRWDLYFPYPEIRDASGRILGAGGLARFTNDEGEIA